MFGIFYLKKPPNFLFDFSIMFLVCFVRVHLILFYFSLSYVVTFFWYSVFFTPEKL